MILSTLTSALALLAIPVVKATRYDVQVGPDSQFVFEPPTVNAVQGDVITFHYHPKAHSVTQSSFNQPCTSLEGGFDTGFVPVDANATEFPTREITINSTAPVWIFCAQLLPNNTGTHCGTKGMVFAVNPTQDKSFDMFRENALASGNAMTSASSAQASVTSTYTTPPAPSFTTVTVTVTAGTSTYTTAYASYDGTGPYATPSPQPVDHTILVGKDGLSYTPNNINASIGDTVTFAFFFKNHTVTRSSFQKPCEPLQPGTPAGEPFDSGFTHPFDANKNPLNNTNLTITITDMKPFWIHCAQVGHCQQGMVAAINAPGFGDHTFEAFKQLANSTTASNNTTGTGTNGSSSASASPTGSSGKDNANGSSTQRVSAFVTFVLSACLTLIIA